MDIGHLTDLLPYAFSVAANFGHTFPHQVVEVTQDIWTGLNEQDAMSESDRNFQILKFAGSTTGLGICAMSASVEGVTAFAIADAEALIQLEKAGHQWRISHEHHTPPIEPPTMYQGPM
jgi:hypothetical protein